MENAITVYGTLWCGDCRRVRRFFERNNIGYDWVDIDYDVRAERFVVATNHGMRSVPTIVFGNGSILVEPSDAQLSHFLESLAAAC